MREGQINKEKNKRTHPETSMTLSPHQEQQENLTVEQHTKEKLNSYSLTERRTKQNPTDARCYPGTISLLAL